MPDKNHTFPFNNESGDTNEFINAKETVDETTDNKSEAEKADETSKEDSESFDIEKVDDLKRAKNEKSDEKD